MGKDENSTGLFPFRKSLGPIFLILACVPSVMILWYTCTVLDGSYLRLGQMFVEKGIVGSAREIWGDYPFGSPTAWKIIGIFITIEAILMRIVPGPEFRGPLTENNNIPVYKDNGLLAFFVSLSLFWFGAYWNLFDPAVVYDELGNILAALNVFAFVFCIILCFKGLFFPSSTDCGSTGSPVLDFYWGTELYPRILGWDVKMLTNCRFGLVAWPLLTLCYAVKQNQLYGYVSDSMFASVFIQVVYCVKFFVWESGYLCSMDIMHDRAGFYICWGCLVWVPCMYTLHTMYLVTHPVHLGLLLVISIIVLGLVSVYLNYDADRQRQEFRQTGGKCLIWGKKPQYIVGTYIVNKERKTNLILCSGWWGMSRHFHYIAEISSAFFWSVPALFFNVFPYTYVIFLTILLTDRAVRDDIRCKKKYGKDWDKYRERVPYLIVPGLF